MVICLERGADLHMAQLMPLPLTVSCFSKIQIGFTFLVPAHLGSPGKGPLNVCSTVFYFPVSSLSLNDTNNMVLFSCAYIVTSVLNLVGLSQVHFSERPPTLTAALPRQHVTWFICDS